jgi:hypothetical protein
VPSPEVTVDLHKPRFVGGNAMSDALAVRRRAPLVPADFIPLPGTLARDVSLTPFVIGDAIKAGIAALLLPAAWKLAGRRD